MKKSILVLLCLLALVTVLSGCAAGNANTLGAKDSPSVTMTPEQATVTPLNSIAPATTAMPADEGMGGAMGGGMTDNGMTGGANAAASNAMTPADAGKLAERISEAVERISEIEEAEAVVRDNRALVAVKFDDQYNAGLDERMKTQITETVQKIDNSLTEVEITDDSTLYGQAKSLAERIGKATGFDELADDIGDLWNRVTGR